QERYGYLADSNGCICVIDLEKGGIVRRISTGKYVPDELWYSDKDSTLVYISSKMRDSMDCNIYRIALDGSLLHTVESSSKSGPLQYFWCMNDTIHYKMLFCDTLFLSADTVTIPYCRLVTEQPYSMTTGCGRMIRILFENKDRIVLCCNELRKQRKGEAYSVFEESCGYYVLNKSDFSLHKVKGFYMDILDYAQTEGGTEDMDFFPSQVIGKKVCWSFSVLQFKELLKDKFGSPLIPEYLKELYHRLDEEDNPVLLVGDIK
ncbi:MAG: hypothetical protein K2I90_11750, partial [Odoribacter sp.]|nr:hypothetical protein [Odoribacter sp.]